VLAPPNNLEKPNLDRPLPRFDSLSTFGFYSPSAQYKKYRCNSITCTCPKYVVRRFDDLSTESTLFMSQVELLEKLECRAYMLNMLLPGFRKQEDAEKNMSRQRINLLKICPLANGLHYQHISKSEMHPYWYIHSLRFQDARQALNDSQALGKEY
jgi:hypothetical protein